MSPMFTTIVSASDVKGTHSPARDFTSRPAALAPTSSVIRLMSSCAPARTLGTSGVVIGG
jgi:hypothetical protein